MARHLGDLVRELREEARLSVRELARQANVDAGIISRLESRKQKSLHPNNLAKLAQTLGTTVDELLERARDEPEPARMVKRRWPTLEEWLAADQNLTDKQRRTILGVYDSFIHPD